MRNKTRATRMAISPLKVLTADNFSATIAVIELFVHLATCRARCIRAEGCAGRTVPLSEYS